ncbi:MAG: hypothetical protein IKA47_11415 [Oscillospiraceae bacterium]|nr:hypothetical protein [Oscillospiraceae bacterium]MBR2422029.1 hypothetical protein [Oscillospiraceae bacterium]
MYKDPCQEIKSFDIPNPFRNRAIVDFELCIGLEELKETLQTINTCGYTFIGATQNQDVYTVFFRRPAV